MLRSLTPDDHAAWAGLRVRSARWLLPWEPHRPEGAPDPIAEPTVFARRCDARDRGRRSDQGVWLGIEVAGKLVGEMNLHNVARGALQSGAAGYWVAQEHAGHGYAPEALVVLLRHAFEELGLHRVEVNIIPENAASQRIAHKLDLRHEGRSKRYIEIAGRWRDHDRYAITVEEWIARRLQLAAAWLDRSDTP